MKKSIYRFFILIGAIGILAGVFVNSFNTLDIAVQDGSMDLAKWDPLKDGPVRLDGNWEFYWLELYFPRDFKTRQPSFAHHVFNVPGLWNDYPENSNKYPGDGYATYRLQIKDLPKNQKRFWLKIPEMPTAYRLWANSDLIAENGKVATRKENMVPEFVPKLVPIDRPNDSQIQLVLQVSNFYHKDGGIWHSLELGGASDFFRMDKYPLLFDALLFGAVFMMGLYHLGLFVLRRQEKTALYFGLFCVFVGLRSLMVGERIFFFLVPGLSWVIQQKLEFICLHLCAPTFCMFFYHLFPKEVSRRICLGIVFISGILIAVVVFTPVRIFGHTGDFFQAMIMAFAIYIVLVLIRIIYHQREGGMVFLIGFSLMLLTVINDTLYTHQLIQTRNMVPFGVLIFIFFQAFLLSKKFSAAFVKIEDISRELSVKNQELLRVDQLKDEFIANTSHELKTPLHGIIGLAESMVQGVGGDLNPEQKKITSMIAVSSRRLFNLINDLLDFSSLRRHSLKLHLKPVDLNSIVDVAITFSKPMIGDRNLTICSELPEKLPLVLADENRLQQILFNLIGNAVKFTPAGRIEVNADVYDTYISIHVKDTGIGIALEDQARIFNAFEQVNGASERPYPGTGLGLAISRKLVGLHNSRLRLVSEIGQGSCFSFDLEIARQQELDPQDAKSISNRYIALDMPAFKLNEPSDGIKNSNGPNVLPVLDHASVPAILIVDDEPVNLQLVYNQLHPSGFRILLASNGQQALEMIGDDPPDLVLLDIMMPHMNGFAVCRTIRQTHGFYELPVILLTARNRLNDLVQGFQSGANDYIPKPFYKEELLARINTLLQARAGVIRLKQNKILAQEVRRRKQVEEKLRTSQRRLARILDSTSEAILAVNSDGLIVFFNQSAENLFDLSTNEVLNQSLSLLFVDSVWTQLGPMLDETQNPQAKTPSSHTMLATGKSNDGSRFAADLFISRFTLGPEYLFTIIVKPLPEDTCPPKANIKISETGQDHLNVLGSAFEELSGFLDQTRQEPVMSLRHTHPDLDHLADTLADLSQEDQIRAMLVKTMSAALMHWENSTGKTKIELAEESKIWKTYLDRGTWKTRTLDKYLNLEKLPKRPRWREVIRTVWYVIENGQLSDEASKELQALVIRTEGLLLCKNT